MNRIGYPRAFLALMAMLPATSASAQSDWVRHGQNGQLHYQFDSRGDRVLDYSYAGYNGGAPLPTAASVVSPGTTVTVTPIAGDNRVRLQNAIAQVAVMPINANGYRGIVQLTAGQYDIGGSLEIGTSGVILRGVGDGASAGSNTILRSTTTDRISLVDVGNFDQYANDLFRSGSAVNIVDKAVPAGQKSFRVANTAGFSVGDWINVKRTPTTAWFDFVTSAFPNDPSGNNHGWNTSDDRYTFQHERQITRIEGDRVFINAPLSHSIDPLSNGTIEHYTDRRVSHVGIEGIRGTTVFNANETGVYSGRVQFDDNDHAETFINFRHAEESWARGITGEHLSGSAVSVGNVSRSITVEDGEYVEPVSPITGGRRYAFAMNGGQFILMRDLQVDSARRAFINNTTFNGFNRGPNVFLNAVATNSFVRSGPHAGYSTGALYDNVTDDGGFEARRAFSPIGHGWRGANTVIWNSSASEYQIVSPPGANNYLLGATGTGSSPNPNDAVVDSFGSRIEFGDAENPLDSLYVAQQLERQRFQGIERREYTVGDFDEFEADGIGSDDDVFVDPAWRVAVDNLSSTFHSGQPVAGFDDPRIDHKVPFSFAYELGSDEEITSAVLTIATKRFSGNSDNDLIWLDRPDAPLQFSEIEDWGPLYDGDLQVLSIELGGELSYLQDGLLNVLVSDDRGVDWAHLELFVAPRLSITSDFNSDGTVDSADYTLWRDTLGSTSDLRADADRSGNVDLNDYTLWSNNFGATTPAPGISVPEPSICTMLLLAMLRCLGPASRHRNG